MFKKFLQWIFGSALEEMIKEYFDNFSFEDYMKKDQAQAEHNDLREEINSLSLQLDQFSLENYMSKAEAQEEHDLLVTRMNSLSASQDQKISTFSAMLNDLREVANELAIGLDYHIKEFEKHQHKYEYVFDHEHDGGVSEPPAPPADPPVEPPVGFINFKELPQSQWARKVNGLAVGFVKIGVNSIMQKADSSNVLVPYVNDNLREGDTALAKRIVFKAGQWVMVFRLGSQFADVANKDIRPFSFDGGAFAFLVMREQIADGINLQNLPDEEFVPVYLKYEDVVEYFLQTEQIEWNF